MANGIQKSVGFAATNLYADVVAVQELLNKTPAKQGGPETRLVVDGTNGPLLVSAIRTYQKAKGLLADGRVDPGGKTWKALNTTEFTYQWTIPEKPLGGFVLPPGETAQKKEAAARTQASRWSRFIRWVEEVDRKMTGNATQSVGTNIFGEGSGAGSTATKLAPGGKMYGNFDFKEFMDLMNEIFDAIPGVHPSGYRDAAKAKFKTAPTNWEEFAEFLFENREKIEQIKQWVGDSASAKSAQTPAVKKAAKPVQEIEQWTCHDAFNTYVKIVYSDGSKKYYMGSFDCARQISNPGDWDWKLVRKTKP